MWEEEGVKYDSQISGTSIWVDEVASSEMETLEEEQILTRVGEWNEDLNFNHVKYEMPVKIYKWSHQVSSLGANASNMVLQINLDALI